MTRKELNLTVNEILARLVLSRHTPMQDFVFSGAEPKFITCFDVYGNEVSMDEVAAASPGVKQGELETFQPIPGVAYYAHLRLAGSAAGPHGVSTRYEIAGPDWKTAAHVTEPSVGGDPDVVVDEFIVTPGAQKFAEGIASGL